MENDSQQSREEGELSDDGEIIDLTLDEFSSLPQRKIEIIPPPLFPRRYPNSERPKPRNFPGRGPTPVRSRRRVPQENRRYDSDSRYVNKRTVLPPRVRDASSSYESRRRSPRTTRATQPQAAGPGVNRNRKKRERNEPTESTSQNSVEDDYNELLAQYKTIQAKLDLIKKEEEEQTLDGSTGTPRDDGVAGEIKEGNQKPETSNQAEVDDDDDEYDELKLRLVALASAAKTQIKLSADELQRKQRSVQNTNRETTSHSTRRRRSRHRSRTPNDDAEQRQKEQARRRRESHDILMCDDPNEQYERFMKLVGYTDKTPSGFIKPQREVMPLRDNYDQVEMEIDSDQEFEGPVEEFFTPAPFLFDAPPPPPPPLPTGTPPSSPPPPPPDEEFAQQKPTIVQEEVVAAVEEEEEEEDEAELLRAQLLKSLKTKQAVVESSRNSGTASPVETQAVTTNKILTKKPSRPVLIPRHPSVVIQIGQDSSEEEEETTSGLSSGLLGGLDSFLKSARASVEKKQSASSSTKTTTRKTGHKQSVKQPGPKPVVKAGKDQQTTDVEAQQKQLEKERSELDEKKTELSTLQDQIKKRKVMLTTTEGRVDMLRQQLMAAEKLVAANQQYIQKLERQALQFRQQLKKKTLSVADLEIKLASAGVKIPPKSHAVKQKVAEKRTAAKISPAQNVKKPKLTAKATSNGGQQSSTIPKPKLTAREKERLRLEKLERQYAEKIQKLKEAQAAKKARRKSVSQKAHEKIRRSLSNDTNVQPLTAEKIAVDTNVDVDAVVVPRRRSFIDANPHMKPEFVDKGAKKAAAAAASPRVEDKTVKLPEGNVRTNIERLLLERTSLKSSAEQARTNDDGCISGIEPSVIDAAFGQSSQVVQSTLYPYKDYTSSLAHFKSYRFSPFFTKKLNLKLTSTTYANKVNPKQVVCRFDLLGTCNDDKCLWQHNDSMQMSEQEMVFDYLSYEPKAAGVTATNPDDVAKSLTTFSEHYYQAYKSSKSLDFMCEKLAKRVKDQAGLADPHNMFTEARKWRPLSQTANKKPVSMVDFKATYAETTCGTDEVVSDQGVRYFLTSSKFSDELESTVSEDPSDVATWVKLAQKRKAAQRNETIGVDVALNVLAKALESNRSSSELWLQYLNLYSQKKNVSDYPEMCAHAVRLAPSFEIYHKHLQAANTFPTKVDVCQQLIDYILTSQETLTSEVKSHQLLEALLIHAWLNVHAGQYKAAIQFFGKSLKSDLFNSLSTDDQCTAWLCYINLLEFHQLPYGLLSQTAESYCRLVQKGHVSLDWGSGKQRHLAGEAVLRHFSSALKSCSKSSNSVEANTKACLPLYRNLVLFETEARNRHEVAAQIYKKLLTASPSVGEIWLLLAELYEKTNRIDDARTTYDGGDAAVPFHIPLITAAAAFESLEDEDRAIHILESTVISLFDVGTDYSQICDPNLLYCKVLGLPLPLSYTAPEYKPNISEDYLVSNAAYFWSNYCMLLKLQGYQDQVTEMYETALCTLRTTEHVRIVWRQYLNYKKTELVRSENKAETLDTFTKLIKRCLTSTPTRSGAVTNSSLQWTDYSFHNNVLTVYMDLLPEEHHVMVYKRFTQMMPDNWELIVKGCRQAVKTGDYHSAKYMCSSVIYDKPACLELWKMVIAVNLHLKEIDEVQKLFWRAVQVLPYCAALWKDMLLFEMCHGTQESLNAATTHCTKLGLNFDDFVAAVNPTKS